MSIWISGDHHFNHRNILQYCNRDFPNIEAHDLALVEAWNNVVKEDDIVYYLGDFTLSYPNVAIKFLEMLNGKVLVLCNHWHHDSRWLMSDRLYQLTDTGKFDILPALLVLEKNDVGNSMPIIMCHYAFEVWDRKHYDAIHFHGHSHGELRRMHNRLDVGVDMANRLLGSYRPFSLHEAISLANSYYEEK